MTDTQPPSHVAVASISYAMHTCVAQWKLWVAEITSVYRATKHNVVSTYRAGEFSLSASSTEYLDSPYVSFCEAGDGAWNTRFPVTYWRSCNNSMRKVHRQWSKSLSQRKNLAQTFPPIFYVLENLHRKFAKVMAPPTAGSAKCLVRCKVHLVL